MRLRFLRHSLLSDKRYKGNGRGFVECTVRYWLRKKSGASKYWPWLLRSIKVSKRAWERTARRVDDPGIETDLTRQRRREHFCRPGQALPGAAPWSRRELLKALTSSKKVVNKALSSHLVRWPCRTEATTLPGQLGFLCIPLCSCESIAIAGVAHWYGIYRSKHFKSQVCHFVYAIILAIRLKYISVKYLFAMIIQMFRFYWQLYVELFCCDALTRACVCAMRINQLLLLISLQW